MSYNFDAAVSPFIKALPPSGLAKFLDIMAANPNIVPLSVGEPDFDIPQAVKDAEINSICEGKSCYTPTLGLLELREAIADDIHKNYGVKYDPKTEIMVTVGVSEALYTTITTIMHPGDEIILPEPCYVANKVCVILAGGKPVSVETYQENGFVPTIEDLEKAVTPKTKAIMLGYPNNPTGAIMSKEQIKAIGDWAVKHDLIVISDELYAHLTYGGKTHTMFTSFQKFRDLLKLYDGIDKKKLQENMKYWLEAIMPICDEYDINMCVHPDDPPYPVFGLPRIIGRAEDIQWMLDAVPNKHNGLTFCAGSFSAGEHNDCVAMAKQFADRTHFVHLRSCYIFPNGNFTEASHLGGRGHLIELCRIFEKAEQEGKCNSGRRLPMRVDHGMTFTDEPGGVFDESNHGHNAGYTLLGRMFAMGQIQGVIATVDDELGIEYKQPGFYD